MNEAFMSTAMELDRRQTDKTSTRHVRQVCNAWKSPNHDCPNESTCNNPAWKSTRRALLAPTFGKVMSDSLITRMTITSQVLLPCQLTKKNGCLHGAILMIMDVRRCNLKGTDSIPAQRGTSPNWLFHRIHSPTHHLRKKSGPGASLYLLSGGSSHLLSIVSQIEFGPCYRSLVGCRLSFGGVRAQPRTRSGYLHACVTQQVFLPLAHGKHDCTIDNSRAHN